MSLNLGFCNFLNIFYYFLCCVFKLLGLYVNVWYVFFCVLNLWSPLPFKCHFSHFCYFDVWNMSERSVVLSWEKCMLNHPYMCVVLKVMICDSFWLALCDWYGIRYTHAWETSSPVFFRVSFTCKRMEILNFV